MTIKKCLLFSDSYSISPLALRKCLLAFDEVHIIDCNTHNNLVPYGAIKDKFLSQDGRFMTVELGDYGAAIKFTGENKGFERFKEENDWAIKKAAIIVTDPRPFQRKYARALRMTYDIDLSNPEFMRVAAQDIDRIIANGKQIIGIESFGGILRACDKITVAI